MEGLIPLVYKTLKKNRTRRRYECLSSGASQSYNIADFYVHGQSHSHLYISPNSTTGEKINIATDQSNGGGRHRRHMSMGDFSPQGYSPVDTSRKIGASPTPAAVPKLMRFRSHRMFSCVTGA